LNRIAPILAPPYAISIVPAIVTGSFVTFWIDVIAVWMAGVVVEYISTSDLNANGTAVFSVFPAMSSMSAVVILYGEEMRCGSRCVRRRPRLGRESGGAFVV